MARPSENKPYQWLAQYYDLIFAPGRTPMDRARERILKPILTRIGSVCDLACGTGITALGFARQGLKTFGVDLSAGMCRAARAKAKQQKVPMRIIQADMRTFRLPEKVDLVTCEFDAINHVPRKSDLGKVTASVARALKPGGYFYFDVNNRAGFKSYWKLTNCIERPGVVFVMRGGEDHERDHAWADIDFFIQEGKRWRRVSERVDEVCWSEEEIRASLSRAGFSDVKTWDATPFFDDPHIRKGCRTLYLARKAS